MWDLSIVALINRLKTDLHAPDMAASKFGDAFQTTQVADYCYMEGEIIHRLLNS
jgi:hypothetical protein